MLILTFKMPRSKRWLLMKGYHEEAKESMQFVYKGNVEDEFEKMAETINNLCCRGSVDNAQTGSFDDIDADSVISGTTSTTDSNNNNNKNGNHMNEKSNSIFGVCDGFRNETRSNNALLNGDDDADAGDNNNSGGMCSRKYRNIMVIGMGLLLAQQFSGQPCVLAYSRVLFEAAGWGGNTSVITVSIMGVVSSFTVMLVDRLGRKTLLATGSTIMLISVSCLSYGFWGWEENSSDKLSDTKKMIVLWSMLAFISGYQVGFGPISWTLLSEIYPTEIRGPAMALSVEVNFGSKFLTQFLFPIVQDILGWGTTFVVFAGIILLGLIFIIFKVPETKGMSLEEIQVHLIGGSGSPKRKKRTSRRKKEKDHDAASDFEYCNMDSVSKASVVLTERKMTASDLAPIV